MCICFKGIVLFETIRFWIGLSSLPGKLTLLGGTIDSFQEHTAVAV